MPSNTSPATTTVYICLGTDGIFDVVSDQKIMDIILERNSTIEGRIGNNTGRCQKDDDSSCLKETAKFICELARQEWLDDLPIETKIDDVTCVIAQYKIIT